MFYGYRGNFVGSYYCNDSGWYVQHIDGIATPKKVRSRHEAIRLIEEADREPASNDKGRAL